MRISEVAKLFAGSCVVYVVVAACSAYSGDERSTGLPSSSSSSSGDGSSSSDSPITNPVGNALAQGHKSGTRLKLRFYEGSDGSRQFIDFWDSELKTRCNVEAATSDGTLRCVPGRVGALYFSDANCKTPAFYAAFKTGDQPTVAVDLISSNGANAYFDYYTLGALITLPAGTTYTHEDGGCGARAAQPNMNYYAINAPLAPTAFVEMTIKTE